jgi:ribosomal protein S18 acetylase RimI-like enzyme
MDRVVVARGASIERLQELAQAVRRDLVGHGASLPASWVEETSEDLRKGTAPGWLIEGTGPGGLALCSVRPRRAFGHTHVEPGDGLVDRATRLTEAVVAGLPPSTAQLDLGATGLSPQEEERFAETLLQHRGFSVIWRQAMDCPTEGFRRPDPLPWGAELHRVPAGEVPTSALAALDWAAYVGTPDAGFVSDTVEEDEQNLAEILQGRLGRFLEEASAAVLTREEHLVGLLLVAEETPRRSVILDIVVHPSHRRVGLGRRLVTWGLRASAALGHASVRLWVTESNLPARRLYESLGFVPALRSAVYRWERAAVAPQPHESR